MSYRGPAKHPMLAPPAARAPSVAEAIGGDHTHVVRFGGTAEFPAWAMSDGSFAVDLRFELRSADGRNGERVFDAARLRALGVPGNVITAAERAIAQGFVLVDPKDEI